MRGQTPIEIGHRTLFMAIEAVASEIRSQRAMLSGDEAEPEDERMLEDWMDAARDLERAYDVASRKVLDMPPYDELVGR